MADSLTSPAMAEHLLVSIDGRSYGIPMASIREVTVAQLPTMVPGLPDYIRGVVLFGDRPTPVVDPARFMNGPLLQFTARSCLVFVGGGESASMAGVLIDDIVGVVNATVEQEQQKGRKRKSPLLAASYVMHEGERVSVMQLQTLLDGHRRVQPAVRSSKGRSV